MMRPLMTYDFLDRALEATEEGHSDDDRIFAMRVVTDLLEVIPTSHHEGWVARRVPAILCLLERVPPRDRRVAGIRRNLAATLLAVPETAQRLDELEAEEKAARAAWIAALRAAQK